MSFSRFELLVFDWDGTLFDSTALIVRCIQRACEDIGCRVPDERSAAYVIGLGLQDALRHAVPDLAADRYPELGQRYRHHYFSGQHELTFFPGTDEMLSGLRARGHRLAVATGKGRRGLDAALTLARWHDRFDATRTAEETRSKPHPQMLLELMDELAVPPERTLMIGDTTHDLALAANAGTAALAVSFGAHDEDALRAQSPLGIVHSTAELRDWLQRHG